MKHTNFFSRVRSKEAEAFEPALIVLPRESDVDDDVDDAKEVERDEGSDGVARAAALLELRLVLLLDDEEDAASAASSLLFFSAARFLRNAASWRW